MRHQQGRPPAQQLPQTFPDQRLAFRVQRAGRFVKQKNRGVLQKGPRQVNPLLFARAQARRAVAHECVVFPGQLLDEDVRVGGAGGGFNFLPGRPRFAIANVFRNGGGKDDWLLQDQRDLRTEILQAQAAQINSVQFDHAADRIKKTRAANGAASFCPRRSPR